jgi:hypothetical protein
MIVVFEYISDMIDKPDSYLSDAFVNDPNALFAMLKSSVDWDESMKARKIAGFGISYDNSKRGWCRRTYQPYLQIDQ